MSHLICVIYVNEIGDDDHLERHEICGSSLHFLKISAHPGMLEQPLNYKQNVVENFIDFWWKGQNKTKILNENKLHAFHEELKLYEYHPKSSQYS